MLKQPDDTLKSCYSKTLISDQMRGPSLLLREQGRAVGCLRYSTDILGVRTVEREKGWLETRTVLTVGSNTFGMAGS